MGAGGDRLQSLQLKKKSQEIHTGMEKEEQKRSNSVPLPQEMRTKEHTDAVKNVFDLQEEAPGNIEALKGARTSETSVQNEKNTIFPAEGLADISVEQRRTSILQGSGMSVAEKKRYIRDYDRWQGEKDASRIQIKDYSAELEASNANLLRLTKLLETDERSASESFQKVRIHMGVLTNLFHTGEDELTDMFGSQYEIAYQNAVDAVREYLDSHANWRWTSQGRERKGWMKELRDALEQHKKYAAEIISGYNAINEFRDSFEAGHGLETIHEEMDLVEQAPSALTKEQMQDVLEQGTPRQMVKALIDMSTLEKRAETVSLDTQGGIASLQNALIQKLIHSPFSVQVECAKALVCMQAGLKKQILTMQDQVKEHVPPLEDIMRPSQLNDNSGSDGDDIVTQYVSLQVETSDVYLRNEGLKDLMRSLQDRPEAQTFLHLMSRVMQSEWSGRSPIWESEGVEELEDEISLPLSGDYELLSDEIVEQKVKQSHDASMILLRDQKLADVQPYFVTSLKQCYEQIRGDRFDERSGDVTLTKTLGSLLAENYMQPENRIRYVSKFWLVKYMINVFLNKASKFGSVPENAKQVDDSDITRLYTSESAQKRVQLCRQFLRLMDDMKKEMLESGIMKPEEDEDKITEPDFETQFLPEETVVPIEIQCCGDKNKLKEYLKDYSKQLSPQEVQHLEHRIRICERIEKLKKTNVDPKACTVYKNAYKVPQDEMDTIDIEKDKFIFEDIVQYHAQACENTSWASVLELMFRQRGILLRLSDILGFRDEKMADKDKNNVLKDSDTLKSLRRKWGAVKEIDPLKISRLVGALTENTVFSIQKARGGDFTETADKLKKILRNAITRDRSVVGVNYRGHFVTVVGIQGDTLFYKDSTKTAGPDVTWQMDISSFAKGAVRRLDEKDMTAENTNKRYAIDVFWLKEVPTGEES